MLCFVVYLLFFTLHITALSEHLVSVHYTKWLSGRTLLCPPFSKRYNDYSRIDWFLDNFVSPCLLWKSVWEDVLHSWNKRQSVLFPQAKTEFCSPGVPQEYFVSCIEMFNSIGNPGARQSKCVTSLHSLGYQIPWAQLQVLLAGLETQS